MAEGPFAADPPGGAAGRRGAGRRWPLARARGWRWRGDEASPLLLLGARGGGAGESGANETNSPEGEFVIARVIRPGWANIMLS